MISSTGLKRTPASVCSESVLIAPRSARSLGLHEFLQVAGDQVDLEIHRRPGFIAAHNSVFERMRHDIHAEFAALHVVDRQAGAIDADRALLRARSAPVRRAAGTPCVWSALPGSRDTIVPTPSTWPDTRWPPSGVPRVRAGSRLTRAPGTRCSRVVTVERFARYVGDESDRPGIPLRSGTRR